MHPRQPDPDTVLDLVRRTTDAEIDRLLNRYLADAPDGAAALAHLRRTGNDGVLSPTAWSYLRVDPLLPPDTAPDDDPRRHALNAATTALTLWAHHQQSQRKRMHRTPRPGRTDTSLDLGGALSRLAHAGDNASLTPRFTQLTRMAPAGLPTTALRPLVRCLREGGVPLDYAELAVQLTRWRLPGGRRAVQRRWSTSFFETRPAPRPDSSTDPETVTAVTIAKDTP
ncbi:type I-E CRISPR-associated protein Cse2/CasB [Kitasatospora sp. NPDC088783]|uniref:type I-E CRISPR-associated protein Cse2/CasB n=1 Tax=Kitasatospora sp. NPDC088783 TaxID=3364077 RepID=UPI003811BC13